MRYGACGMGRRACNCPGPAADSCGRAGSSDPGGIRICLPRTRNRFVKLGKRGWAEGSAGQPCGQLRPWLHLREPVLLWPTVQRCCVSSPLPQNVRATRWSSSFWEPRLPERLRGSVQRARHPLRLEMATPIPLRWKACPMATIWPRNGSSWTSGRDRRRRGLIPGAPAAACGASSCRGTLRRNGWCASRTLRSWACATSRSTGTASLGGLREGSACAESR